MQENSFYYRNCIIIPEQFESTASYFIQILQKNSFKITNFKDSSSKNIFICLSQTNEKKFFEYAELLSIRKIHTEYTNPIKVEGLPQKVIDYEKEKNFYEKSKEKYIPGEDYYQLYFDGINEKKKENTNSERWGLNLFTESEMLYIENSIIEHIPVENKSELIEIIKKSNKNLNESELNLFDESSLLNTLKNLNIICDYFPLNISNFNKKIVLKTIFSLDCPYNLIRSYYGDSVAIYFYWVFFYSKFLIIPTVLSMLLYFLNFIFPSQKKNISILNSFLISFCTQLLLIFWTRKTKELKIEWDNYDSYFKNEDLRKEFKGIISVNKITGKNEITYPKNLLLKYYLISALTTSFFLILLILINTIFLNLTGFIKNGSLYIKSLAKHSEENEIFDVNSFSGTIISLLHGILIGVLNIVSDQVSKITTDKENHKYKSYYNDSFCIKRVLFNLFNTFFCPYYLAFVLNDFTATSNFLKKILLSSEFERVIFSTIFPSILKSFSVKTFLYTTNLGADKQRLHINKEFNEQEVLRQYGLDEFNSYYEYLEIVNDFCYMTIFIKFIPLSGLLIILINFIEIRSDIIKLGTIHRRNLPVRTSNIGSWKLIFRFISWISIFINLYTNFYFNEEDSFQFKYEQLNYYCFWEHVIIIGCVFVRFFWPKTPYWVELFLKRREYRKSLKIIN